MNDALLFLLKTLGLGLLTGFVIGYLVKKVSKLVLFLSALIVIVVFVLGHNEILNIDWLSVKETGGNLFDSLVDTHGERIRIFLQNAPFTIGLIIGGLIGLRKG